MPSLRLGRCSPCAHLLPGVWSPPQSRVGQRGLRTRKKKEGSVGVASGVLILRPSAGYLVFSQPHQASGTTVPTEALHWDQVNAHLGSRPHSWDFSGCPVVRTLPSISGGVGSSPGRGAKDSCGCLRLIWINAGCVIIHGVKACHSVKLIMDHYKHLPRHRLAVHLILSM